MSTAIKTQEAVEVISVSTPMKDLGLCVTCMHAASCVTLKASQRPIWFCEEFDVHGVPENTKSVLLAVPVPGPSPANGNGDALGLGLCANCATKADCMYRQAGKTVINCEEYA